MKFAQVDLFLPLKQPLVEFKSRDGELTSQLVCGLKNQRVRQMGRAGEAVHLPTMLP